MLGVLALVIVASLLFLLLLVLLFFYLARRREWLLDSSSSSSPSSPPSAGLPQVDIEKPLLSNDFGEIPGQISCSARRCLSDEYRHENDVNISSLITHLSPKNREKQLIGRDGPGVSQYVCYESDDLVVGQTLRFYRGGKLAREEFAHDRKKILKMTQNCWGDSQTSGEPFHSPSCDNDKVGIASDPMALRRGGKSLPMEDAFYCQWPLPGIDKFGLFGIFDGHGGAVAAKTACNERKGLSLCDSSEVLKEAFSQTEAAMRHQYEGCTATVLLLWADDRNELFAQCANVGDSACIVNVDGIDIKMTEDHRIASVLRGPLHRMLGDKFLKEQDLRFSSEPYISQVVHLKRGSMAFALLASIKRAVQLVLQAKAGTNTCKGSSADNVANIILNEARTLRTKDNTSVIFLDFDTL
ncbi:unnamed protein product [Spirodela intermedia]|uniref:protein-serine/threonine phosphatase n=1 Tax=Spirodela intermedia TaxID=51605 RepID=A0A7I8I9H2_SPIIN|nr:unnamed protein product [Spirodela intermedia]CAA6654073.1 unnamed protein product [Spirodela intermedia]